MYSAMRGYDVHCMMQQRGTNQQLVRGCNSHLHYAHRGFWNLLLVVRY